MSIFQKLSQINKDIELLEAFGDIKSANILHNKFLKVSQELISEQVKSRKDLMKEIFLLAQNPNNDFEKLVRWYENDPGRYSEEDREYIDRAIEKASEQRNMGKFTTVINPDNPTLRDDSDSRDNGDSNRNDERIVKVDTNKPSKSKKPILDKREQGYVYRRIVGQIKDLLRIVKRKHDKGYPEIAYIFKEKADKLANDYSDFFDDPKSQHNFITQVNRIYNDFSETSPLSH